MDLLNLVSHLLVFYPLLLLRHLNVSLGFADPSEVAQELLDRAGQLPLARAVRPPVGVGQTAWGLSAPVCLKALLLLLKVLLKNIWLRLLLGLLFLNVWLRGGNSGSLAHSRPKRSVTHVFGKFNACHLLYDEHYERTVAANLLRVLRHCLDFLPYEISHTEGRSSWPHGSQQVSLILCDV